MRVLRTEKRCHHFFSDRRTNDASAKHKHIHRIVLNTLVRAVVIRAVSCTHTRNLVRRNACANAGAAQQEPSLCFSVHDRKPELLREVWVVHARE